jgi:hypothetical protein
MLRVFSWCTAIMIVLMAIPANGKVQCSCPKVPADGEGLTSCSASESGGRCNIDFNLFGLESERRAAQLLIESGHMKLTLSDTELNPFQSLQTLSLVGEERLVDTVLIYMTVAAGNQSARIPRSVPLKSLRELVDAARSNNLRRHINAAFNVDAMKMWMDRSDEYLRGVSIRTETIGRAIVSPGCIEFTTSEGLWIMFKANWSPARIAPRCGSPK